ncbi:DUF58 domain-containing protein [Roseburia hominis]
MIKRIVSYIAVVLLTLYCFFLYDDRILGMLLVAEFLYPILGAGFLLFARKGIKVRLGTILAVAEKGQKIPVPVRIENGSRIPAVHFRLRMRIENTFTGEIKTCSVKGCALRGRKTEVKMHTQSDQCGNLRIVLEAVELYDLLHIFLTRKRCKEVSQVGILPECHLVPVEVSRRTREFLADAEEYSDREKGDDPSEIYQIREYKEKDALHDVHWKLSAKSEELLVKEHGKPLGPVVLLYLNLNREFAQKGDRRRNREKGWPSEVLEAVASLSLSLLEEKCVHMAAWYEEANGRVVKVKVSREEHVYELANRLLYASPYRGGEQAEARWAEAFGCHAYLSERPVDVHLGSSSGTKESNVGRLPGEDAFSRIIEFRLNGAVLMNGEEFLRIPINGEKIDWGRLYFTV